MRSFSGQKYIGIIAVLLFLMMAAVGVSVKLIVNVAEEVEAVAGEQLPIAENIFKVAALTLHQRILLQKLDIPLEQREASQKELSGYRQNISLFGHEALAAFSAIHKEINDGGKPSVPELHRNLALIEKLYRKYNDEAGLLAVTLEAGDRDSFAALLPDLDDIQNEIALEVEDFQRNLKKLSEKSIALAGEKKRRAWRANTVLMGAAIIFGIGMLLVAFHSKD
ncbi:MAG: hypothetical protein CMM74_11785 [Rhodospirillaceae bacterium]|jgi:hypothetical protein|nr:hypothetical protein [Rhodospirillaceae bacterium]|tara:strand:+ start:464 stop:1132 length:669 start_codon:yes stop_codon:yes gene_type:complete